MQQRQLAELYLDELRVKLVEDPSAYKLQHGRAVQVIDAHLKALRQRVRDDGSSPNPRYSRQGELAAALICLGMEYPDQYTALMEPVVGLQSIRSLEGVSRLDCVLSGLSDDHDYILVQQSEGGHRLYHEFNRPQAIGFVPLTCAADLCDVAGSLLTQVRARSKGAAASGPNLNEMEYTRPFAPLVRAASGVVAAAEEPPTGGTARSHCTYSGPLEIDCGGACPDDGWGCRR